MDLRDTDQAGPVRISAEQVADLLETAYAANGRMASEVDLILGSRAAVSQATVDRFARLADELRPGAAARAALAALDPDPADGRDVAVDAATSRDRHRQCPRCGARERRAVGVKLSEIGMTRQRVDVLAGGDVGPDGRLLSVAEIQQSFRQLLADQRVRPASEPTEPTATAPTGGGAVAVTTPPPLPTVTAEPGLAAEPVAAAEPVPAAELTTPPTGPHRAGDRSADVDADWITVVSAHSGAGASMVALAIADAAAATGHAVHLIESAHPARSSLVAASSSELGMDPTGTWRRGLRGQVTIDRRAGDAAPDGWPTTLDAAEPTTVVDLGLPSVGNVARLAHSGACCVLVSRATVPGVRLAEQALDAFADLPVVVAVLGPGRWPGEVTSSLGPRLRRLRADGQVVTVPLDRHLEVTGPTHSPLPKSVLTAGRSLLGLIDAARPGDVATTAPSTPRRSKGTTR